LQRSARQCAYRRADGADRYRSLAALTDKDRIETVGALDCRLVEADWAFARDADGRIADYWGRRVAANPTLYDGVVLLANRVERRAREGGGVTLEIDFFATRFSRFLAWREFGSPDRGVYNVFAMPALRSSDGAFLLGEMGPSHSQAGARFFPGGTPDLDDVEAGRIDLSGSLARELAEETGLSLDGARIEPAWRVIFDAQRVACLKLIEWPAPAAEIAESVARYIASEAKPELARAHMVRHGQELDDPRIPAFMRLFLRDMLREADQSKFCKS
jgi:8-oxo-dGTP pyrophosphatase MutT (NUDIX family)